MSTTNTGYTELLTIQHQSFIITRDEYSDASCTTAAAMTDENYTYETGKAGFEWYINLSSQSPGVTNKEGRWLKIIYYYNEPNQVDTLEMSLGEEGQRPADMSQSVTYIKQ